VISLATALPADLRHTLCAVIEHLGQSFVNRAWAHNLLLLENSVPMPGQPHTAAALRKPFAMATQTAQGAKSAKPSRPSNAEDDPRRIRRALYVDSDGA
jgi:hypothetical protein